MTAASPAPGTAPPSVAGGRRGIDTTGTAFAVAVGITVFGAVVAVRSEPGARVAAVFVDLAVRGGIAAVLAALVAAAARLGAPAADAGPSTGGFVAALRSAIIAAVRVPSPFPADLAAADAWARAGTASEAVAARLVLSGVMSPVTWCVAFVAFGPHPVLAAWLVGSLGVGVAVAWTFGPSVGAVDPASVPVWPDGRVVVGMVVGDPDEFVPRVALWTELGLRRLIAGAALVALVVGLPSDAAVVTIGGIVPVTVVVAAVVAFVAAAGAEVAPLIAVAFVPFGPAAVVAAGVVGVVADLRRTRIVAVRYGRAAGLRLAAVTLVLGVAAGCWTAVLA